jgi:beta-aspartyl-peptidase (threonine type)
MRRVVALLLVSLAALAVPRASPGSPAEVAAEARAVLDAQVAAWNRGDLDGFMAAYWRSPDLVFCSGATVTKGWDATLARYRRRYRSEGREMGRLRFDAVEVVPLGVDAAFARGAWRLTMGDGKEPHGLFTLLLRRLDGAWVVVHDHTSAGE